ncbi:hypothetical protein SRHO_G00280690 [Serrasalmus rhombeus]
MFRLSVRECFWQSELAPLTALNFSSPTHCPSELSPPIKNDTPPRPAHSRRVTANDTVVTSPLNTLKLILIYTLTAAFQSRSIRRQILSRRPLRLDALLSSDSQASGEQQLSKPL